MDHQAIAQMLGNYGEFVGAIAVVVTLAYVAVQVRQSKQATIENTKAVRSSIFESLNQTELAFSDFYAEHRSGLAELQPLASREELTAEQNILAGALASRTFRSIETAYLHHKNGILDDELFDARIRGLNYFIERFPGMKGSFEIYRSGAGGYSEEFLKFIEESVPNLRRNLE
jgi:hypothetical protein